jgi:hypothetical protein
VADVVAGIQNAIEIVGKLRALSKKIEEAEFKMLLADLSNELADAKLEIVNLKGKLAELQELNLKQAGMLSQRDSESPTLSEGVYKFEGAEGNFCTACYDVRRQKVQVTQATALFAHFGRWRCPSCKAYF